MNYFAENIIKQIVGTDIFAVWQYFYLFPYFFILIRFLFSVSLFALFVLSKFFGLFIIFQFWSLILSIFVMLNFFQDNLRKLKTSSLPIVFCFIRYLRDCFPLTIYAYPPKMVRHMLKFLHQMLKINNRNTRTTPLSCFYC